MHRKVREGRGAGVLPHLSPAALPLYVLHQPVVVAFAYGVVGWSAPMAAEYAVIVAASLRAVLVLYEYGVRRWAVTRFLFGMRPAAPAGSAARAVICFPSPVRRERPERRDDRDVWNDRNRGRSCEQPCGTSRRASIWCTARTPTG
ncbi:hypothetical protein ACFY3N_25325 [Streptomyces sp. NPDC000348]|uniref:hypothetical protein n=1 Tax=Streptomyces sp. NPDC000348 TaxID=3364538 RepID=UPI0036AA1D8C